MADRHYIYSTLSADQRYGTEAGDILIHGRANVADRHLWTPRGKATAVTEGELEALQRNKTFRLHADNGFIQWSKREADPSKVAKDMAGPDGSAQHTEESLGKKKGRAKQAKG